MTSNDPSTDDGVTDASDPNQRFRNGLSSYKRSVEVEELLASLAASDDETLRSIAAAHEKLIAALDALEERWLAHAHRHRANTVGPDCSTLPVDPGG